ncbi:unnamed protein product [Medioppia subpectinata]|uniref:Uncharacterized protein n=1 Tax=Medioppia subpectinata TaxID=1979941 RepID=A0A7R9L494_9ACAR|nr:unnamed protein product [Medioppia subpectinata]CAG2115282.1 unnamed protein product [Medioppia subpectinata]
MTGEMTDDNKRRGRSFWKRNKELIPTIGCVEMLKQAKPLVTDAKECQTLDQIVNNLNSRKKPFLDNLKQLVGGPGDDLRMHALTKPTLDRQKLMYREMSRGNLVRMVLTDLVPVWRTLEIRKYLRNHPKYRPSPLSDYLTHKDFDLQPMFTFYKYIIDSRSPNIKDPEENELFELTRELIDVDLKSILMPLNESVIASPCLNQTIAGKDPDKL